MTFNELVFVGPAVADFVAPALRLTPVGGSGLPGAVVVAEAYDGLWAWSIRFERPAPCPECGPVRLAELTTYRAVVQGVEDSHGNRMETEHLWNFTTGDFTSPHAIGTAPDDGAFGQLEDVVVSAYFNELLVGLAGVTFELMGPSGPVSGTVTYEEIPGGGAAGTGAGRRLGTGAGWSPPLFYVQ